MNKIDITSDVNDYFVLKELSETYASIGNSAKAGEFSLKQTNLHSKLASNICFYNENNEAARKVMSVFFKEASPYKRLFGKSNIVDYGGEENKINYEKINLRSHCFIYNNAEENIVKVTVESSRENINAKVEFQLVNGNLSDVEGEPVKISLPLDTFRSEDEDPNSIPFNKTAERIIVNSDLVPAYWTSGYSHANKWFCDGITEDEAKRLLSSSKDGHSGGKYQYIMYDMTNESINKDFNLILKEIKKLF